MLIILKLIMLIIMILFIGLVAWLVKKGFKVADAIAVDERKSDIESNAKLAEEVNDFKERCPDKIEAAESSTVKDFI